MNYVTRTKVKKLVFSIGYLINHMGIVQISSCLIFYFSCSIMILGHGANTMTMEEAKAKLCAQAKYVLKCFPI